MLSKELKELDATTRYVMVVAKEVEFDIHPRRTLKKFFCSYLIGPRQVIKNKLLQFRKLCHFWTLRVKGVKVFIEKCDLCLIMRLFTDFWPLKPIEVNHTFKLELLDTAHIALPSGNKKYIVVAISHFMQ